MAINIRKIPFLIFVLILGLMLAGPVPDSIHPINALAQSGAVSDDEDYDEETLQSRAAMQKRAEEVKPELSALLKELKAMKDTTQFKELGFSSKNKIAADWKMRVEEARTRLEADPDLPPQIKVVPASLLSLGQNWLTSKGKNSEDADWDLEMIQVGLGWEL